MCDFKKVTIYIDAFNSLLKLQGRFELTKYSASDTTIKEDIKFLYLGLRRLNFDKYVCDQYLFCCSTCAILLF